MITSIETINGNTRNSTFLEVFTRESQLSNPYPASIAMEKDVITKILEGGLVEIIGIGRVDKNLGTNQFSVATIEAIITTRKNNVCCLGKVFFLKRAK